MLRRVRDLSLQGKSMSQIVPPSVGVRDEPPRSRVQRQLMQIGVVAMTVFATCWCYQLHIALGLTATFLAKHILVAVLAAGLRLPIREIKP
jgi:hypothetical protein